MILFTITQNGFTRLLIININMNIIFNIQGGLGKSIMGTAVCKAIKSNFPESYLIVITSYKDVFLNNPNVNKTIEHKNQLGIYEKYIKDLDVKFMVIDPYLTSDYLKSKNHLIQTWCDLFNLEYNGEQPEFFLSKTEKQYYKSIYKSNKPIFVIQTHGGAMNQGTVYNWARDLPDIMILELISKLKKHYQIVHIKREDQPAYEHTLQAIDGYRSIAYLLTVAKKCLLIDSFVQHLAKALDVKAVVLWITTRPEVFGYELHTNIKANEFTKNPMFNHEHYMPFEFVQTIETIPYEDLNEIFDINKVYNAIKA